MEESVAQSPQADWLIVAPHDWPAQIASLLQNHREGRGFSGQFYTCGTVYEATAVLLELGRQGRTVRVYVLVDYLPEQEMQFFRCWAGAAFVQMVAVTFGSRQKKIGQARHWGAGEELYLNGRLAGGSSAAGLSVSSPDRPSERATQARGAKPHPTHAPPERPSERAPHGPPKPDLGQQRAADQQQESNTEPPTPARRPSGRRGAQKDPTEPVLSQEELDALLS